MKKRLLAITILSMMALSTLACGIWGVPAGLLSGTTVRGSGNVVEEDRTIGEVTGVELATIGTLHIERGMRTNLSIEAEDNLLEHIETNVRVTTLTIRSDEGVNLDITEPINYYLTVAELDTIVVSSSGDIEAPDLEAARFAVSISSSGDLTMGDLACETLTVEISSSGDVTMGQLEAERLNVDLSSSGNLTVAGGDVERQEISMSSSGDYTAEDLASVEAEVTLSSSGHATIRVSDRLDARLSSSGNLYVLGNPTIDGTSNSSGEIIRLEE